MKIYLLDITQMPDDAVSRCLLLADRERREKIGRYRTLPDRKRSLGAGMLLRYAWRLRFFPHAFPAVRTDRNGKPCFVGCDIPFGLSHSGKYAACALGESATCALGLDIQEPRVLLPGAVRRFFSERERERVRCGENPCLIWSRKESLAKFLGTGLRGELCLLDTEADGERLRIRSYTMPDGYAVSLCTGEADKEPAEDSLIPVEWERLVGCLEQELGKI